MDHWRPNVNQIALKPLDPSAVDNQVRTEDGEELKDFERAYLESAEKGRLRFKVELSHEEEHTPRFHFNAGAVSKAGVQQKSGPSGKLVSWVGNAKSIVGNSIAPPFDMPNGDNGTYSVSVALLMACSVKLIVNMDKDLPGTSGELPPVGLVFVTAKRDAVPSTPPSAAEEVDEVDVPRADTRRNSSAAAARRNSSAAV